MGYIDRLKAGIEQGRKETARQQEIQKKIRKRELEIDRKNPSAVGEAIGRAVQRVDPVTKPIRVAAVKTAPKAIKAVTSLAQSISAPPPPRRPLKVENRSGGSRHNRSAPRSIACSSAPRCRSRSR